MMATRVTYSRLLFFLQLFSVFIQTQAIWLFDENFSSSSGWTENRGVSGDAGRYVGSLCPSGVSNEYCYRLVAEYTYSPNVFATIATSTIGYHSIRLYYDIGVADLPQSGHNCVVSWKSGSNPWRTAFTLNGAGPKVTGRSTTVTDGDNQNTVTIRLENNAVSAPPNYEPYDCFFDNIKLSGVAMSSDPSPSPTSNPSAPSESPTSDPSTSPSSDPSKSPSYDPSVAPSSDPTKSSTPPSSTPSKSPSSDPSASPSVDPSASPSSDPSVSPSSDPSASPSVDPSASPNYDPSTSPSYDPSQSPSSDPSESPSSDPSESPSSDPSKSPSFDPSKAPSSDPSAPQIQSTTVAELIATTDATGEPRTGNEATQIFYFVAMMVGVVNVFFF